jgi:succinoglycan biosynthesis protein ExoA
LQLSSFHHQFLERELLAVMVETKSPQGILVVIPTLNEAEAIERVLTDLCEDLPLGIPVRFVVADGGSTDGTPELVRRVCEARSNVYLLHNPKQRQAAGINLAVATYGDDADVVVRCDAHTLYPPGFIRRLIETMHRVDADAVVVPMDSIGRSCIQKAISWVSDTPVGSGGSAHRGGRQSGFVDHGHHAAIRMASFRRAGGYDESFTHNEDAELDCRQRALGSRIYLEADIRIAYFPRSDFLSLWWQYFNYGRGRSRTVRRHPGTLRARQFAVPTHMVLCALSLGLAPWLSVGLLLPTLYLASLAVTSAAIAVRHRSMCGLLAGPAALVMHVAWAAGFLSGMALIREPRWIRRSGESRHLRQFPKNPNHAR